MHCMSFCVIFIAWINLTKKKTFFYLIMILCSTSENICFLVKYAEENWLPKKFRMNNFALHTFIKEREAWVPY